MKILIGSDISDEKREALEAAAPAAEIRTAADREEVLEEVTDADAYLPGPWDAEIWAAAEGLEWVQFRSAGVGRKLLPGMAASEVTVTNGAGVYAVPMAEHALALMLALSRGLQHCARAAGDDPWHQAREAVRGSVRELTGATLGILGYGGIGRETARRAQGLGMRVLAVRRNPQPDRHAEEVWGPDRLDDMLRESDYLLVSCALTDETRGMIGAPQLKLMKPDACIVNVARGPVIDQQALVQALRNGRVGAAGLDVTDPEPLPADSPLWDMENVIITPHMSGSSPQTGSRLWDLVVENVRRYAAGEPLRNVVDKQAGY
jgi:phosphoglycerate dehydrogenase-like enzyme